MQVSFDRISVIWTGDDMKSLLAASLTGLALLSGSALAADLPPAPQVYKAPPVMAPAYNWTGCYLNGGFGYGVSNTDHWLETNPGLVPVDGRNTSGGRGWLGIAGAGCDFEVPFAGLGNWVVGAFGDYSFMNIHEPMQEFLLQGDAKQTGAWAVGGRIGYVVTPNLLAYSNGGYTQSHFDQVNQQAGGVGPVISFIPSHTYNGWFVGGGTEYALNFSWLPISGLFWRNEYRFSSFNKADLPIFTPAGAPSGFGVHMQPYEQAVLSELVWRFNWH
jgi:outer membrane immunogenic protein